MDFNLSDQLHTKNLRYFEKDRALSRRFQKVEVSEPTVDETFNILKGLKDRFEEHHEIKYTEGSQERLLLWLQSISMIDFFR